MMRKILPRDGRGISGAGPACGAWTSTSGLVRVSEVTRRALVRAVFVVAVSVSGSPITRGFALPRGQQCAHFIAAI